MLATIHFKIFRLLSKNVKMEIQKHVIFHAVLHEWETWSITQNGRNALRMLEKTMLRRTLGPKADSANSMKEETHNEEFYIL